MVKREEEWRRQAGGGISGDVREKLRVTSTYVIFKAQRLPSSEGGCWTGKRRGPRTHQCVAVSARRAVPRRWEENPVCGGLRR